MIVFPILNFVLPLMLTSFIIGNSDDCVGCKSNIEMTVSEYTELDKFYKREKEINVSESSEKKIKYKKNSKNVY